MYTVHRIPMITKHDARTASPMYKADYIKYQSYLWKVKAPSLISSGILVLQKRPARKFSFTVRFNPVNWGISSASVAESSIRFFNPGSWVIISAISSWKPNSSDLSNSSIISVWIVSGLKFPLDK